jgi:hypothetical protein
LLYEKLSCLTGVVLSHLPSILTTFLPSYLSTIPKQDWWPVATTNAVPLDFEVLNVTRNGPKTLENALDKDLVLVVSGDQNLAHSVAEELDGPNVNVVPFDMRGGVEGWDEDASVNVMFFRTTYSAMHGASEMQRYMKRMQSTAVVMRATPTGEATTPKYWDLQKPETSYVNEVALGYGRAIDEIRDNLSSLAGRLNQYWTWETTDVENCPLLSSDVFQDDDCVKLPIDNGSLPCMPAVNLQCLPGGTYNEWKYNCCKPGTFCPPGGTLITNYVHPATVKLGPKDFVVAFGVNHVATGLSHYTSLSLYDTKSFLGMFGQTQREMVNSSAAFTSSDAVHFSYAFVYARDCDFVGSLDTALAAARCIEISTGWPGMSYSSSGYLEERQYRVPPPPNDHMVRPSAMHFAFSETASPAGLAKGGRGAKFRVSQAAHLSV